MANVLIIAPHADDETLGAGGALLKHRSACDAIYWVLVADAADPALRQQRSSMIQSVSQALGVTKLHELRLPAAKLTGADGPALVQSLSEIVHAIGPQSIYLPNRSDVHSDHRIVFEACLPLTKTFRFPSIKRIFLYEVLSETDMAPPFAENAFLPNYFIDITDVIDEKLKVLELYSSELGPPPFPRNSQNTRALAQLRGSTAGVLYAEAFQILKWIE